MQKTLRKTADYALFFGLSLFFIPHSVHAARLPPEKLIRELCKGLGDPKSYWHRESDIRKQFIVCAPSQEHARAILDMVESHRWKLYRYFRCTRVWDSPTLIMVYRTQEDYNHIRQVEGSGGAASVYRWKTIKARIILSYMANTLISEVLPHELTHLLVTDLANVHYFDGKGMLNVVPLWMQEGMAENFSVSELRRNAYQKITYDAVSTNTHFSLQELFEQEGYPQNVGLFYAQSFSVVDFLGKIPQGNVKLRNYITHFGTRLEDPLHVFSLVFHNDFPSLDIMESHWKQYVLVQYRDIGERLTSEDLNRIISGIEEGETSPETPPDPSSTTAEAPSTETSRSAVLQEYIKHYQDLIARFPHIPKPRLRLGRLYVKRGDWNRARQQFKKVVEIAPASSEAYRYLGICSFQQGNLPAAEASLRQALKLDSNDRDAYFYLGKVQAEKGKAPAALRTWKSLLDKEPRYADVHWEIGLLYQKSGENKKAAHHLQIYLDLAPQGTHVHQARGLMSILAGGKEE